MEVYVVYAYDSNGAWIEAVFDGYTGARELQADLTKKGRMGSMWRETHYSIKCVRVRESHG